MYMGGIVYTHENGYLCACVHIVVQFSDRKNIEIGGRSGRKTSQVVPMILQLPLTFVFPDIVGPTSIRPWRTTVVSYSWMHFFTKPGRGLNCRKLIHLNCRKLIHLNNLNFTFHGEFIFTNPKNLQPAYRHPMQTTFIFTSISC